MKSQKLLVFLLFTLSFLPAISADAAVLFSQSVSLLPGWNIVSTHRILDSHSFSATENATNFDIYVLDASSTSGWLTMAQEGQAEFTPLYGYFINNKTGTTQTLTFNYKAAADPNERLFSRTFTKTGWYSFGIANPSYALGTGTATTTDTNNPSSILNALVVGNISNYDTVVDFTNASSTVNINSISLVDPWKAVVNSDVNTLNDFRETKGYAIYIKQTNALYIGQQNNSIPVTSPATSTASLAITMSTIPTSQTVPAGLQGLVMANVKLGASQSGEDVRISSLPLRLTVVTGVVGNITSCQLFDGSTALNTGSNVPSNAASGTATTFTFDNSKVIPKGTILTLELKCNVSSNAPTGATYTWSVSSGDTYNATSASGLSVTPSVTTANSGTFTIGSALLTVVTDPSSPAYYLAVAGTSGVTLGAYKFSALNDDITITRVGVNLGAVTASSTEADITQLTLWAGGSQVGTVTFPGGARAATSTALSLVVPKNGSVTVTVKGDLAAQGANLPTHPGALLTVDVDINGATGNKNTSGISQGATINPTGSTAVAGVRVFRTTPTVARIAPSSSTLVAQAGITLYQFSIAANAANDLALARLTINVATSSASTANGTTGISNLKVYGYTDSSFSNGIAGFTDGQIVATIAGVNSGNNVATTSSIVTIPKGQTYYFRVKGTVSQVAGTTGSAGTVSTYIVGDAAYPSLSTLMGNLSSVSPGNFLWSPLSTTSTVAANNLDWTNGFGVPGLPSGGTDAFTLSK